MSTDQGRMTWCPECGPLVRTNEDGFCTTCWSTATGAGASAALALAAERDAARAEVAALKAGLAKARGLRLGRAPTAEDIRAHGIQGRWLISWKEERIMWEICVLEFEDGRIFVDGSDDGVCHIVDAIPIDDDDQPCPIGGWESSNG